MQQQAARGIVVASLRGRGCRGGRHRPLHAFACESAEHIAADERTCGMRLKQSEKSVNVVCQAKHEGQGARRSKRLDGEREEVHCIRGSMHVSRVTYEEGRRQVANTQTQTHT